MTEDDVLRLKAPLTEVIRGILAQPSATWKDIRSCVMAVSQVGL